MNLVINYDYFNAVQNVNEKMTPFKVIRNEKVRWSKSYLPLYSAIDLLLSQFDIKIAAALLTMEFGVLTATMAMMYSATNPDVYSVKSELLLRELVKIFKEYNIDTSIDLVKKSELYDKKYEIKFNEKRLPEIIQSKYILLPTYNYLGDVKETSIVQKHIMGSKEYVLSLGRPKKVLKPAYSNI